MASNSSRSPLVTLFVTVFLDLLGFGMVIPILALYAKKFDVSDTAVTTAIGTSYSLMQLVFSPIWGRISDRYGRRPVLLVSIAGSALSQLGYALAPGFWALVAARSVAGICGANISAAQADIADTTDEKSRAAGMALLGTALGLGFVLGPFFGGVLGDIDPRLPFFVASGLAAVNFGLAYFTLVEPAKRKTGGRALSWSGVAAAVGAPRVRTLLVLFFVLTFGFANLEQAYPFYLSRRFDFSQRNIGLMFAYIGVIMVLTQGLIVRRTVARFGERALVVAGTALLACGMVFAYLTHSLPALFFGTLLVSLGNGLTNPSLSSLLSRATAGDRQGSVLGVSQSAGALGRILAPITAGLLLDRYGVGAPFLLAGCAIGAGCLYAFALVKRPEPFAASPTTDAPDPAAS